MSARVGVAGVALLAVLWAAAPLRAADTVIERAALDGTPIPLAEGDLFSVPVALGGTFRSVDWVRVELFFVGDRFAAGERILLGLDGRRRFLSHALPTPQSRWSLFSTSASNLVDTLLDGQVEISVEMLTGSVTLSQIVISAKGDFVTDAGLALRLSKSDRLVTDHDRDGMVDPGDVIEYLLRATNTGTTSATGVVLDDVPDALAPLIAGSVVASAGTVTQGNGAGDRAVRVEIGTLAPGAPVIVVFRAAVAQTLPPSVLALSNQATLSAAGAQLQVSDDPDTPAPLDPTFTPLENEPIDRCERSLDACEAESAMLRTDLALCEADLGATADDLALCEAERAALLADADGDGVLDLADHCASTAGGAAVDALGCSLAQFCAAHDRGVDCALADWHNDEPRGARDCRPQRGHCVPRPARPGRGAGRRGDADAADDD